MVASLLIEIDPSPLEFWWVSAWDDEADEPAGAAAAVAYVGLVVPDPERAEELYPAALARGREIEEESGLNWPGLVVCVERYTGRRVLPVRAVSDAPGPVPAVPLASRF